MNMFSETELAIAEQPRILGLNWTSRMSKEVRSTLKSADRIAFVGTGTSYHAAVWAQWLCTSSSNGKLHCRVSSTWDELVRRQLGYRNDDELLIVISHRGNKSLTHDLLATTKPQRCILITGEGAPTGRHPFIHTSRQEISQAHTMSFVGALGAVSEVIATFLPKKQASHLRDQREDTVKVMERAHKAYLATVEPLFEAPETKLHFIGGGPFHAMALELALKAREIAHMSAQGYNVEEVLHGPFTSIEDNDALVLVDGVIHNKSPSVVKKLYTKRMQSCADAAEAIGTMTIKPRPPASITKQAASLDLSWQAFVPLLWGQLFTVAQAKHWGFNPDSNRQEDPRYREVREASEY